MISSKMSTFVSTSWIGLDESPCIKSKTSEMEPGQEGTGSSQVISRTGSEMFKVPACTDGDVTGTGGVVMG